MSKSIHTSVSDYVVYLAIGSCSSFTYTSHPPSPLPCKPYSNGPSPVWTLKTTCVVKRNTTDTTSFEIHWIHRNADGVEKDLGIPTFNYFFPNVPQFGIGGPRWTSTEFTEDMVGQYWCQAFFYDGTALPVYSNAINVLRPEEYDSQIPVCPSGTSVHVNESDLCNDEPPQPLTATSIPTGTHSTSSDCDEPTPSTTGTKDHHSTPSNSLTHHTSSSIDQSTAVLAPKEQSMIKQSISSSPLPNHDTQTHSHHLHTTSTTSTEESQTIAKPFQNSHSSKSRKLNQHITYFSVMKC